MAGDSWKGIGRGALGCGAGGLLLIVGAAAILFALFFMGEERERRVETGGSTRGADFVAHCVVGLRLKAQDDPEWALARPGTAEPIVVGTERPQAVTCMAELPGGITRPYTVRALCSDGLSQRCTELG